MNQQSRDNLINLCRKEKVNEGTVFLFHECEFSSVPAASGYFGEWIWSSNVELISKCYKECVMWTFLAELCHYSEEVTEEKTLFDLLDLYESINGKHEELSNLRSILETQSLISDYKELMIFVKNTVNIFESLNLECDVYLCNKFDDVIEQVEIHNEGIIPVYETMEEYLTLDGYY